MAGNNKVKSMAGVFGTYKNDMSAVTMQTQAPWMMSANTGSLMSAHPPSPESVTEAVTELISSFLSF